MNVGSELSSLTTPTISNGSLAGSNPWTWTISAADINTSTFSVTGTATGTTDCPADENVQASAEIEATDTVFAATDPFVCTLSDSSSASVTIVVLDDTATPSTFSVSVPASPAPSSSDGFQTGDADAATLNVREDGEGDFIPFQADMAINDAGAEWANATFNDDFGGDGISGQTLVSAASNPIEYTVTWNSGANSATDPFQAPALLPLMTV